MNVTQLEKIRELIKQIRNVITLDSAGSGDVSNALSCFREDVTDELKKQVWARYLDRSEQ